MVQIKTYKPEIFPDLIERVWIAENGDNSVELMIPPNQYVNLIIPLNNSSYSYEDRLINRPQLEGISLKNTAISYPARTRLIGIRFHAFGLYPFLNINGMEFINDSINCPIEASKIKHVTANGINETEELLISRILSLLSELYDNSSYEKVKSVKDFYQQFRWNEDTTSIEDFCKQKGTNYTTLNRSFSQIVGISTKKFERLIKFRKSLCSLIDSNEKLTSIASESGYFDQAHFIREFKMFLNHTPSDYQALIKLADTESKIINYNFRLF